jgi:DNA-binding NarL/FixJ family response regulator
MATTVAVIEDNPEFLNRFVTMIESCSDFSFAGAATNGADGKSLIDRRSADVYLIDLGLPDFSGINLIRHAATVQPDCEVLVITVFGDDTHVIASIEAGATGYLLKDSSATEIADCIRMLCDGGARVSPIIARRILQRFRVARLSADAPACMAPEETDIALTGRESEVLRALGKGLSYKEIGDIAQLSTHTVAHHVKNVYRKLTVHSRGEAVYEASKRGLLDI